MSVSLSLSFCLFVSVSAPHVELCIFSAPKGKRKAMFSSSSSGDETAKKAVAPLVKSKWDKCCKKGDDPTDASAMPNDVLCHRRENGIQGLADYLQPEMVTVEAAILSLDAQFCVDYNCVSTFQPYNLTYNVLHGEKVFTKVFKTHVTFVLQDDLDLNKSFDDSDSQLKCGNAKKMMKQKGDHGDNMINVEEADNDDDDRMTVAESLVHHHLNEVLHLEYVQNSKMVAHLMEGFLKEKYDRTTEKVTI